MFSAWASGIATRQDDGEDEAVGVQSTRPALRHHREYLLDGRRRVGGFSARCPREGPLAAVPAMRSPPPRLFRIVLADARVGSAGTDRCGLDPRDGRCEPQPDLAISDRAGPFFGFSGSIRPRLAAQIDGNSRCRRWLRAHRGTPGPQVHSRISHSNLLRPSTNPSSKLHGTHSLHPRPQVQDSVKSRRADRVDVDLPPPSPLDRCH